VSRSLGIVAVGAVCLGALGAAITLPAMVLGGSEAPPAGLALAGSGTHTVVHAAPLRAPRPARPHVAGFSPVFVPSLVPAARAVPIASPVSRPSAATPVKINRPKERRASKPKPAAPRPAEPQPPAPEQTLSTLSEKNKHAKPKKHEHAKPVKAETTKTHVDHPKGDTETPKPKHEHGPKPKHDGGPKSKDQGGKPPKDESQKPPEDHEDKPPKSDGDKGSDGKAPKH
jgi:hypothetical protein